MKFDVGNHEEITVTGDFALDRDYSVTVDAGTPAAEGMKLDAAFAQAAQFERKAPQLAFPDFSAQQLGAGRREWDLFALNVSDVRLRLKLVPADQAPFVLAQYKKQYYGGENGEHTEKNKVGFDKLPGKIIYDTKIKGSQTGQTPDHPLKWDDFLGAGRNGIVLLEAEQPNPPKGRSAPACRRSCRSRASASSGKSRRGINSTRSSSRWPTRPRRARPPCAASTQKASRSRARVTPPRPPTPTASRR